MSIAVAALALLTNSLNAADIFYDDFSGASGTPLNGLAPDIRPGSETWLATRVDANGLVTSSSATSCWLPYTFANDKTYVLSTTVTFPYTSGNGTPLGIAFTKDNPRSTAAVNVAGSNDYGVLQVRRGGSWGFYGGPENNGTPTASAPNNTLFSSGTLTNYEIKLILITSSSANWTLAGYFNGVQVDLNPGDTGSMVYSFAGAQAFTGAGFNFGSTTNDFQSFTLSTVDAAPLIFTSTKAAAPGDLMILHGARFINGSTQPQVWIDQITGTTDVPNPETQMTIVSSSSTLIHAQVPTSLPLGLYAVFVNCGGAVSAPVWVNRSEAWQILDLAGSQCDPNRVFRISGWNVDLPGATSIVYFQNTSSGVRTSATVANVDNPNILTITAPATIVPGQSYQLVVSNGHGGTQGETYGPVLSCVATPVDALALGVPWADEFAFAADQTKTYNVKNAPYNAVGDGVANDRPAISAACTAAFNAGGGRVYLPAGTYNLQIPVIELESLSYTVSSGDTRTVIADALCSGGYYTSLTADAVGDYVSFTANIPLAGTYEINVMGKVSPTQGKAKLFIDGVQVGGTWDQYDTTVIREKYIFGTTSLTAGNHTFRFEVTGKNTASTGYDLALDNLIAKYTLKPNKRVVLQGAGIDVTTLLTDIEPYAVHSTNGSVFHNGTLDMTVKGQISWSTGNMPNAGPVVVARVKVDNPFGSGGLLVNSGKIKTLVRECNFISGGSCFQGIGADNLLVKNCTLQWSGGRIVAYLGHDIQVDGCTMTRKIPNSPDIDVTFGGWEVSRRDNLAIINCLFNKLGDGPIPLHNDGETILNQGIPRQGAGMVTSATTNTLTDATRVTTVKAEPDPQVIPLMWTTDQFVGADAYAVIVAGTGQGQWRKIIANTTDTVTVETPWDIIPSTDSAYTVTEKDEHWLIANNSFQNCPRPTWLYSATMTDVAVMNNDYINCMDIYLRADQRLTDEHGRFSVFRNVLVQGNEMVNTDHLYASQMSCHGVIPQTESSIGNGFWDVILRNNLIDTIRPNLTTGNHLGVNGEGYFAACMGSAPGLNGRQTVKGVVFDKNQAYDLDKAFNTSTGAMQTTIWKPVISNIGTLWSDVILSGATQGALQTVVQP